MKKNFLQKTSRAFTLLELLISLGILTLLMLATTGIFARSFGSYLATKNIESGISDAQFLMNLLSKELRTSTVVSPTTSGSTQSIKFYEYSKSECVQYRFNSTSQNIEIARDSSDFVDCENNTVNFSDAQFKEAGSGPVSGSFTSVPSKNGGSPRVGVVTTIVSIDVAGASPILIQTTTSLRDYGYIGLQ